jgi:hypothetical protein
LFLPLAASYMTDVAGLFCILVCLYLCQRAVSARTDLRSILWLILGASSNVVGGTVRQIAWLGAIIMVPSTAWLLRKRRGVPVVAPVLWLASVAAILAFLRWFHHQPYALDEKIYQGPIGILMLGHMVVEVFKAFLCLSLLTLPILIAWVSSWESLSHAARTRSAGILVALLCGTVVFAQRGSLDHRVMPWLGHVLGTLSIVPRTGEMLGTRPVTLTLPWRAALSLLVASSVLLFLEQMAARPWKDGSANQFSRQLSQAGWIVGPYCCRVCSLSATKSHVFLHL